MLPSPAPTPTCRSRSRPRSRSIALLLGALALLATAPSRAGGPLVIDHLVAEDDAGIWKRSNQLALLYLMVGAEVAGAVWEGAGTRAGRTSWQSVDATVLSAVTTESLKRVFRRARPSSTGDPDQWFGSGSQRGFPSGEASATQAIVTPWLIEYGREQPVVYALEALPVYDAIARVKVRAHWQSDVLAGMAIGATAGWYAHARAQPLMLQVLPHGIAVGLRARF